MDSQTIAMIRPRVSPALQQYNPHAVILYWDSDISNIDESSMSNAAIASLRKNYTDNVFYVINEVLTFKTLSGVTPVMALAGPGLLGEAGVGLPSEFYNKTTMLEAYKAINVNATRHFGIPYIDMRSALLAARPPEWVLYRGWVTQDGEHPNRRGALIEAQLFAKEINIWLNNATSPLYFNRSLPH